MSSGDPLGPASPTPSATPFQGRPRRRFWRLLAGLALIPIAAFGIGWVRFVSSLPDEDPRPPRADAIVVLTGGADRIADAVALLAADHGTRLLITGVHQGTRGDEIAALLPAQSPRFACCVDIDRRALNTAGNATETARWVRQHGFRSLIVVTSAYHMPRALVELAAIMPGVALIPHPVVSDHLRGHPWWSDFATARLLLLEYAKYVAARARHGLRTPNADASRQGRVLG